MYRITGYLIGGGNLPTVEETCTARTKFGAFIKMLWTQAFYDHIKLEIIPEEGDAANDL